MHRDPLQPASYFHLYNRSNSGENLFRCDADYLSFLGRFRDHTQPHLHTLAYCLMPNHFHFLIYILGEAVVKDVSQALSNCFNSYAKWFNTKYERRGSLFQKHPKHKAVDSEEYLRKVMVYIHQNPVHHGYVAAASLWRFSSYTGLLAHSPTELKRQQALALFGGAENFIASHNVLSPPDFGLTY